MGDGKKGRRKRGACCVMAVWGIDAPGGYALVRI